MHTSALYEKNRKVRILIEKIHSGFENAQFLLRHIQKKAATQS